MKEVEAVVADDGPDSAEEGVHRRRGGAEAPGGDLRACVFGQDDAVETVSSAIKLARAGLRDAEKPIGCYLFSGPTGVGKTELARQLARVLGIEFIRFDMSEYMEHHAVSRLIGAPPGYVGFEDGGLLVDAVREDPPRGAAAGRDREGPSGPLAILLQVMDHATLTDNHGARPTSATWS